MESAVSFGSIAWNRSFLSAISVTRPPLDEITYRKRSRFPSASLPLSLFSVPAASRCGRQSMFLPVVGTMIIPFPAASLSARSVRSVRVLRLVRHVPSISTASNFIICPPLMRLPLSIFPVPANQVIQLIKVQSPPDHQAHRDSRQSTVFLPPCISPSCSGYPYLPCGTGQGSPTCSFCAASQASFTVEWCFS